MKFIVLLLTAFPVLLHANPGSWTPVYQNISEIFIEGSESEGSALIVLEGGVPSSHIPSDCNSKYNTVFLSNDKGRSIYSMALAAYMSGKTIKVALACTSSRPSRPLITNIRLK